MTTQFIAHAEQPRTFADRKGAAKAIKRDLGKHADAHGDVLFETGYDVKPSGDRFGVVVFVDLTPEEAAAAVGEELNGYVIEPQLKEEPKTVKPSGDGGTATTKTRRSGEVNVRPTAPLVQCRAGTRQQDIVDMLAKDAVFDTEFTYIDDKGQERTGLTSKVGGASLAMLRTVCVKKDGTTWDDNSIRSALYYDVANKGYGVGTIMVKDEPFYVLRLPEGASAPLDAKARKS